MIISGIRCQDNDGNEHMLHEMCSPMLAYAHTCHCWSLCIATWITQHMKEPFQCCTVDRAVRHWCLSSSTPLQGWCQPHFRELLQHLCPHRGCFALTRTAIQFCHQVAVVLCAPPVRTGVLSRDSENRQFGVSVADSTRHVGLT